MGGLVRGKRGREREMGGGGGGMECLFNIWWVPQVGPTNLWDPDVVRGMLHETVGLIREFFF